MRSSLWLFLIPAALGVLGTWAGHTGRRGAVLFKGAFPASLLALAIAASVGSPTQPSLARGVAIGLLLCVPADVLLAYRAPGQRPGAGEAGSPVFAFGLAGFLLAYLTYGVSFLLAGARGSVVGIAGAILAAAGLAQYRSLRSLPPALKLPVAVYVAVVSLMVAGALGHAFSTSGAAVAAARWLIAAGALLIYASDSLIAGNLFRAPLRHSELLILPPYYIGQICIVLALWPA